MRLAKSNLSWTWTNLTLAEQQSATLPFWTGRRTEESPAVFVEAIAVPFAFCQERIVKVLEISPVVRELAFPIGKT
jgi:hypothetical protein